MTPDQIAIVAMLVGSFAAGWGLACAALARSYKRAVRDESTRANLRDGARMLVWVDGRRTFDGSLDDIAFALHRDGKAPGMTYRGQVSIMFKRGGRL